MDGIILRGSKRPKSKKQVKELVAADPSEVFIEHTSLIQANRVGGLAASVAEMRDGEEIHFVGPDPYKDRKFYGTITRKNGKFIVK